MDLQDAAQQYLVHVKGALYRKTPYILALFGGGVGLFDAHSGRAAHTWRFADDGVTVAPVPGDADDMSITVRGKASSMQRMLGKTEAESRWVVTCAGNRSDVVTRVLSMREVALGDVPEPAVFMGAYRASCGARHPQVQAAAQQPAQLLLGAHSLAVSSAADGELLADLTVCGLQRVRRLGDVQNGFAIRHLHQWHVLVCDERNTVMTLLREKCDRVGLPSPDIIFGCSLPLTQVEREAGLADRLRQWAIETWSVLLQPAPKAAAAAAGWRNANAQKRILMLTRSHVLECDSDDCHVVSAREIMAVRGLKRWLDEPQRFTLEFGDGNLSTYDSPHRDHIMASISASLTSPSTCLSPAAAGERSGEAVDQAPAASAAIAGANIAEGVSHGAAVRSDPPRIRVTDALASHRLLPANSPTESCVLAEQIVVKRLAALVDSGVLIGGDDEDILNPHVVAAAAQVCENCLGGVLAFEGRDIEAAVLCLLKQLQGRKTLDRGEPSEVIAILECLMLLAGTKTGWGVLTKIGAKHECRAGIASVIVGLGSHHDEILLAALSVILTLVAPPFLGLGKATLPPEKQQTSTASTTVEPNVSSDVQKNLEALRDELLTEAACERLGRLISTRTNDDGGAGLLITWQILRLWQSLVCEPGKRFSTSRLQAACTSTLLSDNGVVTALLGHRCRPVSSAAWHILEEMVDTAVEDGFVIQLQMSALRDGAVLRHLHAALYHPDPEQQALSRRMCAMWLQGNQEGNALMARCLPFGMSSLVPTTVRAESAHAAVSDCPHPGWHAAAGDRGLPEKGAGNAKVTTGLERTLRASPALAASLGAGQHSMQLGSAHEQMAPAAAWAATGGAGGGGGGGALPSALQKGTEQQIRLERCRGRAAWEDFLESLQRDRASIIQRWNDRTRQEMRTAMEKEASRLEHARDMLTQDAARVEGASTDFAWNHEEFCVEYLSLESHLCVGGIFIHDALEALAKQDVTVDELFSLVPDVWQYVVTLYRTMLESSTLSVQDGVALLNMMQVVFLHRMSEMESATAGATRFPFYGIPHLVEMLLVHKSAARRDALLGLLGALVANKRNAQEFIRCGGVQLLIKMAAMVHVDRQGSSSQAAMTSNLLEAGSPTPTASDEYRYWYRADREAGDHGKPLLLSEMAQEMSSQQLSERSLIRAKGESEWKELDQIPQLSWAVGVDWKGGKSKADVGVRCLQMLLDMCALFPSADEEGRPKLPSPRIRRLLLADDCLCHIVQLLLAGYPNVVDKAMALLDEVLHCVDSSCLRRLYKTGFYFFALAYSGSNLQSIASILKKTHLCQDFYRQHAHMQDPLSPKNSVLRDLVPESLICFLTNHDAPAFAAMMLADCDTPEAIWHHKMRQHLIACMSTHILDFSLRLREDFLACYEYVPLLTAVHYHELEGELWCQPYFLRNLVNTEIFPEWRIDHPFQVLRAVIDLWRREQQRQTSRQGADERMSVEQALAKLGLLEDAGDQEVRKAYRKLAVLYHPDKNPEGRAEFELVQKAYQVLSKSGEAEAEDPRGGRTLELLMKTQAILYERCATELAMYRYPCYQMLCTLLEKEMQTGNDSMVCACAQVLAITAAVDPGNAQELVLTNGLAIVVDVLHRCLATLQPATARDNEQLKTCAFACQAAAAVVGERVGRAEICKLESADDNRRSLVRAVVSAMRMEQSPALRTAALHFCVAASQHPALLAKLVEAGALWSVLGVVLRFEAGASVPSGPQMPPGPRDAAAAAAASRPLHLSVPLMLAAIHNSSAGNWHSVIALWALSSMSSAHKLSEEAPEAAAPDAQESCARSMCQQLRQALDYLLTPSIAQQVEALHAEVEATCQRLSIEDAHGVRSVALDKAVGLAQMLATNSETATCLWTPHMRLQLLEFIGSQEGKGLTAAQGFTFKALQNEMCVAGVYLRTIVNMPAAIQTLASPGRLSHCILCFLASKCPSQQQAGDAAAPIAVAWNMGLEQGGSGAGFVWEDWDDEATIRDVSHDECSGRMLSTYLWDNSRWQEDACLALSALAALVSNGPRPVTQPQGEQELPASALHVLRRLPLVWVLMVEQADAPQTGGVVPQAAMCLLQELARLWPGVLAHALGRDSYAQARQLTHHVRTCTAAQLPAALDLMMVLTEGSSEFVEALLACGGFSELLGVRMGCHASLQTASGPSDVNTEEAKVEENVKVKALRIVHAAFCDRMHAPRVRQELLRWLPPALVSVLSTSSSEASSLLDSTQQYPDLIWSPLCADELRAALLDESRRLLNDPAASASTITAPAHLPFGTLVAYSQYRGMVVVGGVFLELLIKEPTAPLKDAATLLDALVRALLAQETPGTEATSARDGGGEDVPAERMVGADGGVAQGELSRGMVFEALMVLLRARTTLAPQLARAGHLKALTLGLGAALARVREADAADLSCSRLLEVARLAAGDKECAEAMASTGLLRVVVNDVARTPRCPSTLPISVDLLREAAGHQVPRVGLCLLECGCVEALLNLLAEGVNPAQQVDGAARVHAIETLKGLEIDVEAGSHVAARLAGSTVWENCKGQRHDLFLATGGSASLMLTGPSSLDVGIGPQRSTL